MNALHKRYKPFINLSAWILIFVGLILFSLRVQFQPGGWINLPIAFTVFQTAGLMFALFGLQLMASLSLWPDINVRMLMLDVLKGNVAAGLVLLGLLLFNGISLVAIALWLTSALGAGIGAS